MMFTNWFQLFLLNAGGAFASVLQQRQNGAGDFESKCASIASQIQIENTTVFFSEFVPAGTNLSLPEFNATCGRQPYQQIAADICRVSLYVTTSNRSGIHSEAWLPSNWTGRFLSAGNGGLAGCINYDYLTYTSGLGFAAVADNNGHNGTSGGAFLNNPDVVEDFAYRSLHTSVVVGKQVSETFYGSAHKKSYYFSCSTGGRQGFKEAQDFPEDFDGIIAGAPAFSFDNLTSWSGHFYPITGPANSSTFVPRELWSTVHADVLKQCDMLDNYADGILEDASICNYTASGLLCGSSTNSSSCLTQDQVDTVNEIYSPLLASDGSLIYPRLQPGAEEQAFSILFNSQPFPYTTDWFRYAIYNDPNWDPTKINVTDYENAARIDPFNIQTWKGDLSGVRDRGAKILHWHGQEDAIISSENSPRYYEHVLKTMNSSPAELDAFYRYFRVSGTGHCFGGKGASVIGQGPGSIGSMEPSENILMAMVDWVENGNAPETVVGVKWNNGQQSAGVEYKRAHCRYPRRNKYKGGDAKDMANWECVE
ncbi:tannase and feruloyl esterase [Byssothecium circinans]|uniref:Carboxylic ester hydrolase n=1 Tax=Byssothecium circinans TaxID=147558 RepID=A0A6A5TSB6_9PLEO|nr:tannase and feruloyl esterase [Byssothecium circinans]